MSGLDLQDSLQARQVNLPVIVITGHGDVPITVRAMKAGAFEFLQKPFNDQVLLDAIHAGLEKYSAVWDQASRANRVQESLSALTPREKEVLARLGHGKANKMVAYDMGLSGRTVEGYRSSITPVKPARASCGSTRTSGFRSANRTAMRALPCWICGARALKVPSRSPSGKRPSFRKSVPKAARSRTASTIGPGSSG